ncbi:hypothetical protein Pint_04140 [Pistacia integerrima]|uniref:Uncharacterized protein n=1 Tax=Pistacia integerrima TaxID=434235 RepID=A0ACC0Z1D9_9ROSI|nr:hypothetical protein Pint_04140 [Pistacia integerrima]
MGWVGDYWVGGTMGNVDYEKWASTKNFHVGDVIVFNYNDQFHDVKEVALQDFPSVMPHLPWLPTQAARLNHPQKSWPPLFSVRGSSSTLTPPAPSINSAPISPIFQALVAFVSLVIFVTSYFPY